MTDLDIIAEIIRVEGGIADDADDAGGITKFGITIGTLSMFLGRQATAADILALTVPVATQVYQKILIVLPGFDKIANTLLRAAVIDAAAQHWVDDPAKWLQTVAKVAVDGHFGPISAAAVNALNPTAVLIKFLALRIRYYGAQITNRPVNAKYAKGWMIRVTAFLDQI